MLLFLYEMAGVAAMAVLGRYLWRRRSARWGPPLPRATKQRFAGMYLMIAGVILVAVTGSIAGFLVISAGGGLLLWGVAHGP